VPRAGRASFFSLLSVLTQCSPRPGSALAHSPEETRPRSGSWLGRLGEGRRRSTSVASQSPTSPVVGRANRSPSVSGPRVRALSISIDSDKETVPDVLGSLMFSPRADKLEESFVIENQSEVKDAVLLNSAGLSHFYKAEYKGEKVLQKVIKYRNIDDRVLASFEKEVAVLSTLSHPNIVRFIGAKATPPDLFMVLEWMARGSLSSILLDDLSTEISWEQRLKWGLDVARGIEYLHSLKPKIIHRDLRCDNVMVNEQNVAKVSEFGLSRRKRFAMKVGE
jgi:tRNA A-37 threonylcarbamoyl transferase component Bud32